MSGGNHVNSSLEGGKIMVTINFEIGGFDLAEVLKSVAGQSGVHINIYTLQEVGNIPGGISVSREVVKEDTSPANDEIYVIDKELSFEEQNDLALEMREHGASWKYIGLALDITPKSASRRLNQWIRKKARRKASAINQEKQAKKLAEEESKKETFEGFTDEELALAIHATVSAGKSNGTNGLFLSSVFTAGLIDSVKRRYKKDDTVKKFKKEIRERVDNLFRNVGLSLGRGAAITSTTSDEQHKVTVQIMTVNSDKILSWEDVKSNMVKQGWL